jgi:hypothetical protein
MTDVRVPLSVGCDKEGVLDRRGFVMVMLESLYYSIVEGCEVCLGWLYLSKIDDAIPTRDAVRRRLKRVPMDPRLRLLVVQAVALTTVNTVGSSPAVSLSHFDGRE